MYLAICDDQAEELVTVTTLLNQWQRERKTSLRYQVFRNAAEMLDAAEKERFSLYLLDVMMPGMNGLAAAREIRQFDDFAEIVFLTSSPGFAYESYSVHALDYLLKPVRPEILFPILDRLSLQERKPQDGLSLKSGTTWIRLLFSQLEYVEVMSKHLYFNLIDGQQYDVKGSLKDYEALMLCRPEFIRVGRSYVVNILQIKTFSPTGISTFSGKQIPIPRRIYSQLQKDYMTQLFNQREI